MPSAELAWIANTGIVRKEFLLCLNLLIRMLTQSVVDWHDQQMFSREISYLMTIVGSISLVVYTGLKALFVQG